MTNAIQITDKEYRASFNSLVTFYAYQKSISLGDSEDLAQNVMVKAMRTFDADKGAKFQTHLYNVSRTMVIDFYRTKKEAMISMSKFDKEDTANSPMQIADTSRYANGYDMLVREDTSNRIMDSLEKLPQNIRTTMTEFYVNQLKINEISVKHNMPIGSVKGYLSRGRKALVKKFK